MEDQGKGQRSASSDRNSGCLELGGLDDADGNKRGGGGREPPPSHDGNMWHVHTAKHAGHRTKQSRVLVDSRHRGAEGEVCLGPKTVPEGPPLTMTLRERSLIALPSVPHATALATKGDQGREGPCLVGTGRSSRVQPMVKAIQDDDTKTSHEEPLATTEMEPALLLQIIGTLFPPARGKCGRTVAGNNLGGGMGRRLGSHGRRAAGDQKNGLPQRSAGPGRNLGPDLGGK